MRKDQEQEILVLKEMVKSVNMQLKSKDIDIQRLNIKIKRLQQTQELADELTKQPLTSPRAAT